MDCAFGVSMALSGWSTCLCKLSIETVSWSTTPNLPTPAAARYIATGHPKPPAPMTKTEASRSRSCPVKISNTVNTGRRRRGRVVRQRHAPATRSPFRPPSASSRCEACARRPTAVWSHNQTPKKLIQRQSGSDC